MPVDPDTLGRRDRLPRDNLGRMLAVARVGRAILVVRRLALLAVLLGLLAMHGVAMSHHAQAAAKVAGAHSASEDHHGAEQIARSQGADAVELPSPVCDRTCQTSVATLCLAVLTVAALGAVGMRRRGSAVTWMPVRRPRPPVARGLVLPPPDPVRELCVSRT